MSSRTQRSTPAVRRADLDRRIAALALPVVATLAAEPLYELTDIAILGHLGATAVGGAAVALAVLGLGYAVFIFLLFGTTATTSRLMGAGRADEAAALGVQALWLGAGLGVLSASVLWPAGPTLISWFGADGEVAVAAETYLTISLLGLPAHLVVMAGVGYLRGTQDTRTPLAIAVVTVVVNLVLEVIAIYGLGFGVGASALSTVLAKWLGAALVARLVLRAARTAGQARRPRRDQLALLSATAWPLFVRTAALRVALAAALAVAGRIGRTELAAYAIGFQVWMTMAYLVEGLEVAAQALVAHALGAEDRPLAATTGRRVLGWAVVVGAVCGIALFATRAFVAGIFSDDAAVVAATATSLAWVAAMQPLNAATFALDGVLVGAGDLRFLAWAMVGATAAFVPLASWVAVADAGLSALWATVVAFMAFRGVALGARFATQAWHRAA
jgi:putative MATE family efflux protein